jgi:hypothetical protein
MGAIIRRKKSEKDVEESQATGSGISLETRQWTCPFLSSIVSCASKTTTLTRLQIIDRALFYLINGSIHLTTTMTTNTRQQAGRTIATALELVLTTVLNATAELNFRLALEHAGVGTMDDFLALEQADCRIV